MKKILLVGGTGGLGNQLTEHLSLNYTCISVGSKILDVTNEEQVKDFLSSNYYDVIIYLSVSNIDGLIHKQTKETAESQINVNLFGFLNVLRHCTNKLRDQKYDKTTIAKLIDK